MKLAMVYGLIFKCPMGCESGECIFGEVRKWPFKARLNYLDQKSDDQILKLYLHHCDCLLHREKKFSINTDTREFHIPVSI